MSLIKFEHCHVVTPLGHQALKGADMGQLCDMPDVNIFVEDGIIKHIGKEATFEGQEAQEVIDLQHKVVLPGFVDSHTHLVFGGFRPDEFGWRLKGDTYMSIMQRGGGIQSTVDATRNATKEQLEEKAMYFLEKMAEMGVTTVEAKSGYGLDFATEEKMLQVLDELKSNPAVPVEIVSTFMGAHAIPREFNGDAAAYVEYIIKEMLPAFKDKADFCDIFTEKNVFEIEDSRRLMQAAKDMGYKLKFHADEIVTLGGAELAAELGALSADHLLHVSDAGIKMMAENNVVATLLPLTAFALKEEYAPARKFIDSGCAVALATDLNPGSCFSGSIPLTIALACIYMKMSIEETITALTLNGAAAIGKADSIGSIEVGKKANFAVLQFDNYHFLPYYVGMNCVDFTIVAGELKKSATFPKLN